MMHQDNRLAQLTIAGQSPVCEVQLSFVLPVRRAAPGPRTAEPPGPRGFLPDLSL